MNDAELWTQADLLHTTAGVRVRDDVAVIEVAGDDRRTWLNGQVSNDVRATQTGDAIYALVLNVRGKIVSDLWALDRGESFSLIVPRQHVDALRAHLDQYIIMEDVTLTEQPHVAVISVQGPRSGDVIDAVSAPAFPCDELGTGGHHVLCESAEASAVRLALVTRAATVGGGAIDPAAVEIARLRRAVPRVDLDFDIHHYPQEAGLKQRAVSFSKGCYLGQEVVCTLESRGKLSRRLVSLRFDGVTPRVGEAIVTDAGEESGAITSVAIDRDGGHALGYVRRIHIEPARPLLTAQGTSLALERVVGNE